MPNSVSDKQENGVLKQEADNLNLQAVNGQATSDVTDSPDLLKADKQQSRTDITPKPTGKLLIGSNSAQFWVILFSPHYLWESLGPFSIPKCKYVAPKQLSACV